MKSKLLLLVLASASIGICSAQKPLPVIKATSKKVDIAVDGVRNNGQWNILPEAKPDVFITSGRIVTFYTDIDSITIKVNPKKGPYDFVVLLNGKDSALTRVEYRPSYLSKLKKAKEYSYKDVRPIPAFAYQPMDDPNLVRVRQELKLDSIAGPGNEISRILNLLSWVHNTVRHDGGSYNPESKNVIDLVNICNSEKRGVNCRMMATMLNDCYLALGFKSRCVTCMPRELKFDDCHVINMVYSNDLKRWIWVDPTFDAYVMNEKGELLGLKEVRERLIEGKPLILNPNANWNRQTTQTKEHYLESYMAKNLYRLEVPLVSRFNNETSGAYNEMVYVELLPLDAIEQDPQRQEHIRKETNTKYVYYKTNNPNIFWQKPE